MTTRPASPPRDLGGPVTAAQRAAITTRLGALPEELLVALRDGRGHDFQRLEFLGDALLELVVRLEAYLTASAFAPDDVTTDAALARAADRVGLDAWLEWEPSPERRADLVEACAAAAWLAHGWPALVAFTDDVVHPLTAVTAEVMASGSPIRSAPANGRGDRAAAVLGAAVLEVAADLLAYADPALDAEGLTLTRNATYHAGRVAERARDRGWPGTSNARAADADVRDEVEIDLTRTVVAAGVPAALERATELLR